MKPTGCGTQRLKASVLIASDARSANRAAATTAAEIAAGEEKKQKESGVGTTGKSVSPAVVSIAPLTTANIPNSNSASAGSFIF